MYLEAETYRIANDNWYHIISYYLCFNDFLKHSRNVCRFNILLPALFVFQRRCDVKKESRSLSPKSPSPFSFFPYFLCIPSLFEGQKVLYSHRTQFVLLPQNSILLWNEYFTSSFFTEIRKSMFCTSTFKFYSFFRESSRYVLDTIYIPLEKDREYGIYIRWNFYFTSFEKRTPYR